MDNINCLIVDDEPPAIRLIEKYVDKVPFLNLVKSTTSSLEALNIISSQDIDLVFLDIQMPELTGIQLSKIIKEKTKIIFTTAYAQFAIESYELNAIDYLLKPIEFGRFYESVMKVNTVAGKVMVENPQEEYIFIKTDGKNNFEKVMINEICYVEGLRNYVAIHLKERVIITYNTLKSIEEYLPKNEFIKTHKSYIIALKHIKKTDSLSVYIKDKELPIGDTYKKAFFEIINRNKL